MSKETGFRINPIEIGQTFVTENKGCKGPDLQLVGIVGPSLLMLDLGTQELVLSDLEIASRHGRIGKHSVVEVIPPVNQRLIT